MTMKLVTPAQASTLGKGSRVTRFPINTDPEVTFDAERTNQTETYEVRSINHDNDMVELVMVDDVNILRVSPGDIGRVFIKSCNLVAEKKWWMEDNN